MQDFQNTPATTPHIESASASTECQTNNSKFAYILTAGVLGTISVLAVAFVLLLFAAVSAWDSSSSSHAWDAPDYGFSDELPDGWSRYHQSVPNDDIDRYIG